MEDLNLKQFEPYIFILIGIGAILFSLLKKTKLSALKNSGEKVEGVVYELGQAPGYNTNYDLPINNVKDKVTIRFLTKEKKWITGDIKQPFALMFTGQYTAGQKVDVYYDREDPSKFFVETKQSENLARIFVAGVGLIFCSVGLYMLYA